MSEDLLHNEINPVKSLLSTERVSNGSSITSESHLLRRMNPLKLHWREIDIPLYRSLENGLLAFLKARPLRWVNVFLVFYMLLVRDLHNLFIRDEILLWDCSILVCFFVFVIQYVCTVFVNPSYWFTFDCAVDFVSFGTTVGELSWFHSFRISLICFFVAVPFRIFSLVSYLFVTGRNIEAVVSSNCVAAQLVIRKSSLVLLFVWVCVWFGPVGSWFVCLLLYTLFVWCMMRVCICEVLVPMETVLSTIKLVHDNPLNAATPSGMVVGGAQFEMLERSMRKFASMLLVGFGEGGASHIADCGKAIVSTAIFGYIRIEHFNLLTNVLGDKICLLVNQVAEIVHGIVDQHGGFPCRNDGSGFLVCWRPHVDSSTCERALLAFCEIVAKMNQCEILASYCKHPKLAGENFSVQVHLSLHLGKGIEGTIGGSSEYKLDLAYLGPDVVLVEKLETLAANVYKKRIVFSKSIYENLSKSGKLVCRQIDHAIYTIDLDVSDLHIGGGNAENQKEKLTLAESFQFKTHLHAMRAKHESRNGKLFRELFRKAFLNYECGEWDVARKTLRQTCMFWLTHDRNNSRINLPNKYFSLQYLHSDARFLQHITIANDPVFDGPSIAILNHMLQINSL